MEQESAESSGAVLTDPGWRTGGSDTAVPVLGGGRCRYASLDHAASTPPFVAVQDAVTRFGGWYANVHRGTGFKSRLSSWLFEDARRATLAFVGADPATALALFTRNTTESLNHVAQRLPLYGRCVVTTMMEHHSNDLPWRRVAEVVRVGLDAAGGVDEAALKQALRDHEGRVKILAVSGASNVTGIVNPVHRWARWAHDVGARIVVDGAQWVPHRPVDMRAADDPEHLDFLAFSAHKMYAPYGVGVLIGPRADFEAGEPRLVGGGTVDVVDTERVVFADAPDREEAGTPCIVGAVALAAAIREYRRIGWDAIIEHERELNGIARRGLREIPGVTLYGDGDNEHLAVIAFNVEGVPHALVSAVLSDEWGMGTRSGCFCAHGYVKTLLGIDPTRSQDFEERIIAGDRREIPGAVRASFGLGSTQVDAQRLVEAVGAIAAGRFDPGYTLDSATGEYDHAGAEANFAEYFSA
ncbi:MAG TPA: aminotransferase class V-fold PLP-dependent enzyme [Gemmatimonadales bacterium]|jgi:selenocysteine lyase/cysteine desulfurase